MSEPYAVWDEVTGARYLFDPQTGETTMAEEAGLMEQAGRQVADIGSGIKDLAGAALEREDWRNDARAETNTRNEAFAGTDQLDPYTSIAGQALPGMATFPMAAGSVAGSLALNAGIGAVESGLDMGAGGGYVQRALAGAAGGIAGDLGGRLIGRVAHGFRGIMDDIGRGRAIADNPVAQTMEDMGGPTLASERMAQGSPEQLAMRRAEQGANASMLPPKVIKETFEARQQMYTDQLQEAIGLPPGQYNDMGPETLQAAQDALSEGFDRIGSLAAEGGPMQISQGLADDLAEQGGQIARLMKRGRFKGLSPEDGVYTIDGSEWMSARRALSQDAAKAFSKGDAEIGEAIASSIDELDAVIMDRLPPGALEEFARVREQYRVLQIAQKPGVINANGDVSVRTLNTKLNSEQGFGRTAKQGLATTNPESKALIDLARVGASPDLQPFPTSGTAENQALRNFMGDIGGLNAVGVAGQVAAPLAVGASTAGGGRAMGGLLSAADPAIVRGGGLVGRGALDEALYPFVGIDDERER